MNFSTTNDDFKTLINGVDERITFIQHIETGFYNITKARNIVHEIMIAENEPVGIPTGSLKPAKHWFGTQATQEMIEEVKAQTRLDCVYWSQNERIPKKYSGTFVHELLVDHFLTWLDPKYGVRVSVILKQIHARANREILKEKDDKIDILGAKIDQLLEFGNKIVGQNDRLQLTVDMTREELSESLDYLVEKSYHSTIDPDNESKITHFAALAPINESNEGKTILIRGQRAHIEKKMNQYEDTHHPVIDTTYNANAINLIENSKQEFKQVIRTYVREYNAPITSYNAKLQKEISKHNREVRKSGQGVPREYLAERKEKISLGDIPVSFSNTAIHYITNPHISYERVISIIRNMNGRTQKSPLSSDTE